MRSLTWTVCPLYQDIESPTDGSDHLREPGSGMLHVFIVRFVRILSLCCERGYWGSGSQLNSMDHFYLEYDFLIVGVAMASHFSNKLLFLP